MINYKDQLFFEQDGRVHRARIIAGFVDVGGSEVVATSDPVRMLVALSKRKDLDVIIRWSDEDPIVEAEIVLDGEDMPVASGVGRGLNQAAAACINELDSVTTLVEDLS